MQADLVFPFLPVLKAQSVLAESTTGSIEFHFLCLVARSEPELGRAQHILRAGIDFPKLFQIAEYHGVRPQLVEALHRLSWENVPAATRTLFENFRRFHGTRALFVSGELCRLAEMFSKAGLRFATFKGPALATVLYGDVSSREYVDLDIIVSEQQVDDAERLLGSLGYDAVGGTRAFRQAFLAHLRQYAFMHPGNDLAIDLHWSFTGTHVPFPLTPAEVWQDLDNISIGGREIPTVSGENLALLLAGHGTKEAWRCLGWICDFATLIDRFPGLDWRHVHGRASARRCGDTILLGCAMAQELLATPAPRALLGLLEENRRVRSIVARLTRSLTEGLPDRAGLENFSDLHLCERRIDKVRGAMKLALSRSSGDYEAMKLPPALWSIYYVTRPFRLGAKALAALGRHAGN